MAGHPLNIYHYTTTPITDPSDDPPCAFCDKMHGRDMCVREAIDIGAAGPAGNNTIFQGPFDFGRVTFPCPNCSYFIGYDCICANVPAVPVATAADLLTQAATDLLTCPACGCIGCCRVGCAVHDYGCTRPYIDSSPSDISQGVSVTVRAVDASGNALVDVDGAQFYVDLVNGSAHRLLNQFDITTDNITNYNIQRLNTFQVYDSAATTTHNHSGDFIAYIRGQLFAIDASWVLNASVVSPPFDSAMFDI